MCIKKSFHLCFVKNNNERKWKSINAEKIFIFFGDDGKCNYSLENVQFVSFF